jgi:hypothetical protein
VRDRADARTGGRLRTDFSFLHLILPIRRDGSHSLLRAAHSHLPSHLYRRRLLWWTGEFRDRKRTLSSATLRVPTVRAWLSGSQPLRSGSFISAAMRVGTSGRILSAGRCSEGIGFRLRGSRSKQYYRLRSPTGARREGPRSQPAARPSPLAVHVSTISGLCRAPPARWPRAHLCASLHTRCGSMSVVAPCAHPPREPTISCNHRTCRARKCVPDRDQSDDVFAGVWSSTWQTLRASLKDGSVEPSSTRASGVGTNRKW